MRIIVDKAKCTGIGICEMTAPDVFEVTDEGPVRVRDEHTNAGGDGAVRGAVEGCPTGALRLSDDEPTETRGADTVPPQR